MMKKLIPIILLFLVIACSSENKNSEQNSAIISKIYGWVNSMPGSVPSLHFKGIIEKPDSVDEAEISILQNDEFIYKQIKLNIIAGENGNEFISEGKPVKKNLKVDEPITIKIEIISSDNIYLYIKNNYKLEQTF